MLDTNTKLTLLSSDSDDFIDFSNDGFDFSRDPVTLDLKDDEQLFIGFYKPVNTFYVSVKTPTENETSFVVEYHNGNDWTPVENLYDETKGFSRSGYISWKRPTDSSEQPLNSISKHYIRLTPSFTQPEGEEPAITESEVELNGINLVFCNDQDLSYEVPEVNDTHHLAGKASHIQSCYAATLEIIQNFRNKDYKKRDTEGKLQDLTAWDLLEIQQIKQAAVFLTLSKIYFNFSDQADDKYKQKSDGFYEKYQTSVSLARLSVDYDDDGEADEEERLSQFSVHRITR